MAACSDNILIMWDSLISVYRMGMFSLDSMLSPWWSVWTLGPPSRLSAVSAALSRPALCKHFSVMGVGPASSPWPLTPLQTCCPLRGQQRAPALDAVSGRQRCSTLSLTLVFYGSSSLWAFVCRRVDSELKAWSCFSRRSLNHRLTSSETDKLRDTYYTSVTVCTVGLVSVHILVFLTRVNQKLTTSPKVQMY